MSMKRRDFLKSAALLAFPAMPTVGFAGTCTDDATLLNLGLKKQLFFDNLLVESVQDITREFHQPRKYEGNPLIVKDKPWEHVLLFRTSAYRVLQDPKDKLFKCWYADEGFTNEIIRDFKGYSSGPLYRDLYAYSEDGLHWVKPKLGIYRENGEDTNILWGDQKSGGSGSRYVIIDPFESDESKRFKTIYYHAPAENYQHGQIEVAYSADGLHWKRYDELPSFGEFGPHLGDVTILSYDLDSKLYILNTRHPQQGSVAANPRFPKTKSFFPPTFPRDFAKLNKRRIFQSESKDFVHWSEPALLLAPDEEDNLDDYLYGMVQYRVGDTRVGLLDVLHSVANVLEVQLAYSLDGRCWKRTRKPWLTAGPAGNWDQIMVEIASHPLEVGDELWFYYGGSGFIHHDWYTFGIAEGLDVPEGRDVSKGGFFLGLAKLRLDGFCSLNAGAVREGILITRPLASPGTGVVINAECGPGGYIDVEVFNQADEVLPGYSRKDFDRFTGNKVRHALSWQSRTKVPEQPFRRLIFYMRNAKLYSLNFSA
jgi:hypothetical protein